MNNKNIVARYEAWINPIFDAKISSRRNTELTVIDLNADDNEILDQLKPVTILHIRPTLDEIPEKWRVTDELISKCPNLICVSSTGAGYDTINIEACTRAGIAVVGQMGVNAKSVAEMAIGLMLSVSRRITESHIKLTTTRGFSREDVMGSDIGGKTLGLVGIGYAGTATAKLANAFGMKVIAFDPLLSDLEIEKRGATPVDFSSLLKESDIISLHCPRNESTRNMFDLKAFKDMKEDALFVTTARGGIHDEQALYEVLSSGHLRGAGLDVWQEEPPALDHPLLSLPNVVCTYHTAGVSLEGRYNVASEGADQIIDILDGKKPERFLNPEVWEAFEARRNNQKSTEE